MPIPADLIGGTIAVLTAPEYYAAAGLVLVGILLTWLAWSPFRVPPRLKPARSRADPTRDDYSAVRTGLGRQMRSLGLEYQISQLDRAVYQRLQVRAADVPYLIGYGRALRVLGDPGRVREMAYDLGAAYADARRVETLRENFPTEVRAIRRLERKVDAAIPQLVARNEATLTYLLTRPLPKLRELS